MNVGIVTYHYADNYGAVLQCLALQRTLSELGADVSVINYLPPSAEKPPIWRGWGIRGGSVVQSMRDKFFRIRYVNTRRRMRNKFEDFREEYLRFSETCRSNDEIDRVVDGYDVLVAGSDQIWNYACLPMHFLDWSAPFNGKRISYAPCCGRPDQNLNARPEVKEWLSRFDHISVRNEFSKNVVSKFVDKEISVVADPTVLARLTDVEKKVPLPCDEYILMYTLGHEIDGGHNAVIREIREKNGDLPVVAVIPTAHKPHIAPCADIKILDAGPAEWLWLIANASFVYTDSFHGALFSMKYRKPFLAYYAEQGRAPRLLDLAGRYGVGQAVVGSVDDALEKEAFLPLDYPKIERMMDDDARRSIEFLRGAVLESDSE